MFFKKIPTQVFSCEYWQIYKENVFYRTPLVAGFDGLNYMLCDVFSPDFKYSCYSIVITERWSGRKSGSSIVWTWAPEDTSTQATTEFVKCKHWICGKIKTTVFFTLKKTHCCSCYSRERDKRQFEKANWKPNLAYL